MEFPSLSRRAVVYSDVDRTPDNRRAEDRWSIGTERRDGDRRRVERRLAVVVVAQDRRSLQRRHDERRASFDRRLLERRIMMDRNSLGG
jgi:hypothetical protein